MSGSRRVSANSDTKATKTTRIAKGSGSTRGRRHLIFLAGRALLVAFVTFVVFVFKEIACGPPRRARSFGWTRNARPTKCP